ncbi:MAG: hypothetical protein LBS34_02750 [Rickettsiales bacterium]|jgi:predicted RND superfamily exporter protein|nr:hypothetical protein [Rickettsiales bacterium]
MSDDDIASFMQVQTAKKGSDGDVGGGKSNSTKDALDQMKKGEEDEKKKELDEAKKESKHNASKYAAAQANLMRAQGKQLMMVLPFIIMGIIVFLIILTKGGTWMQGGMQFVVGKVRGE